MLASLERKAQGRPASRIFGDADDAARHVAFESVACGEECGVRSAVADRDTETLGAADGDVRAEFAGRLEQCQSEQIGSHGDQCAGLMSMFNQSSRNRG